MATFHELGIPFPLFEAAIEEAPGYVGLASCSLCTKARQHVFVLGIGCALMIPCPSCGAVNGLDTYDREATPCRQCRSLIPFPDIANNEILCCYSCLRAGKAAIAKDTELGLITWESAVEGVTHGIPELNHSDFEMVPRGDVWVGARLPSEVMLELLGTPIYSTWQGDCWLFCCKQPMVYVGNWDKKDFTRNAPDGNGRALFERTVPDFQSKMWDVQFWDGPSYYVFRCSHCGRLRSHWDMD
jgi:uncharacterized protein CbrC (UPF0167 family)